MGKEIRISDLLHEKGFFFFFFFFYVCTRRGRVIQTSNLRFIKYNLNQMLDNTWKFDLINDHQIITNCC
jgi:hypothetical protein